MAEDRSKTMSSDDPEADPGDHDNAGEAAVGTGTEKEIAQKEIGGREGPDPSRYGDWEKAGRCIDFQDRHRNQETGI